LVDILDQTELFYKLIVVDIVSKNINQHRLKLREELISSASDPIVLKRRFRMLSQLADYESQIYKKIYNFKSNDPNDYVQSAELITQEIQHVTDRSG